VIKKANTFSSRYFANNSGGTNHQIDLTNPDNLAQQPTDAGVVPNLKWSFSDSKARIFNGGWTREQVVTDLPSSPDIAAAQQHLHKGAVRELHWHRVVGSRLSVIGIL
jgi:oxalate decarboxylase